MCNIFTALNLILNCPGLELAAAVYRGLLTKWPLFCISYITYVLYVPSQSSDIMQRRFWPNKACDSPILKVGNTGKVLTSLQFIACYFYLFNLACNCFYSY